MVARVRVWCKGIGCDVVESVGSGAWREGMQPVAVLLHGAKRKM